VSGERSASVSVYCGFQPSPGLFRQGFQGSEDGIGVNDRTNRVRVDPHQQQAHRDPTARQGQWTGVEAI
jgi:hypothetical protein